MACTPLDLKNNEMDKHIMNCTKPYHVLNYSIGKGSFGIVYLGIHKNGKLVAVKTEPKTAKKNILSHENNIIKTTSRAHMVKSLTKSIPRGIIHSRYFWEDDRAYYLVTDLMGPSIDALHRLCGRSFSLKTTLMLSEQMLSLIQYYHGQDVIHRDIKPSNFLINYSVPHQYVSLIDFGLAKKYRIKGTIIPFTSGATQVGSLRYMSKNIHNSIEPACRDDMYSMGYCMIFLFTGVLPWQDDLQSMDRIERKMYVAKCKKDTTNEQLVAHCQCLECQINKKSCSFRCLMKEYFDYIDSLDYGTEIDYGNLLTKLKTCFKDHGYISDHNWDWNKYYIVPSPSVSSGM